MDSNDTVTVQVAYSPCLGEIGTTKELRRDEAAVLVSQGRVRYADRDGTGTTVPAPPHPSPPPAPQPGPPPAPKPGPAPGPPAVVVPGTGPRPAPEQAPAGSRAGRQQHGAGESLSTP